MSDGLIVLQNTRIKLNQILSWNEHIEHWYIRHIHYAHIYIQLNVHSWGNSIAHTEKYKLNICLKHYITIHTDSNSLLIFNSHRPLNWMAKSYNYIHITYITYYIIKYFNWKTTNAWNRHNFGKGYNMLNLDLNYIFLYHFKFVSDIFGEYPFIQQYALNWNRVCWSTHMRYINCS